MPEEIKNGDVKMQIPVHHTNLLFLYYSVLIYLLLLLLRVPRSISVHVCLCECVNVPLCVCARLLAGKGSCEHNTARCMCGSYREQVFQSWFSSTSRGVSSLQLYYVPQASKPVSCVWDPVSPSHPPPRGGGVLGLQRASQAPSFYVGSGR